MFLVFPHFLLTIKALNLEQQARKPPDLAKVGILRSTHMRRVAVGRSDLRGAPFLGPTS
jgi:hypothetical protein